MRESSSEGVVAAALNMLASSGSPRLASNQPSKAPMSVTLTRAFPHYRGGLADRIDTIKRENGRLKPYLFPETRQQQ